MRRQPGTSETELPSWPIFTLHKIANYIFESGNRVRPGEDIPCGEPIDGQNSILRNFLTMDDTELRAVMLALTSDYSMELNHTDYRGIRRKGVDMGFLVTGIFSALFGYFRGIILIL